MRPAADACREHARHHRADRAVDDRCDLPVLHLLDEEQSHHNADLRRQSADCLFDCLAQETGLYQQIRARHLACRVRVTRRFRLLLQHRQLERRTSQTPAAFVAEGIDHDPEQPRSTGPDAAELAFAKCEKTLDVGVLHEILGIGSAACQRTRRAVERRHQRAGVPHEAATGQPFIEYGHCLSSWNSRRKSAPSRPGFEQPTSQ
jgi:hypothetical protein